MAHPGFLSRCTVTQGLFVLCDDEAQLLVSEEKFAYNLLQSLNLFCEFSQPVLWIHTRYHCMGFEYTSSSVRRDIAETILPGRVRIARHRWNR